MKKNNQKTICDNCGKEFKSTKKSCECNCNKQTPKETDSKVIKIQRKTNIVGYIIDIIGRMLLVIGIIYIISDNVFKIEFFFICFALFLLMYALSEIIQILHDIRKKLYNNYEK